MTALLPSLSVQAATPDYSYDWDMLSDGSNDTGTYYEVVRSNTSLAGNISVDAWESNHTANIDFANIKNVTLYLNATDIDLQAYANALQATAGGQITIVLNGSVDPMNFTVYGIPAWDAIKLDGKVWNSTNYTYDSSTDKLNFTLNMSSHTITLDYVADTEQMANLIVSIIEAIIPVFLVVAFLGIAMSLLKRGW